MIQILFNDSADRALFCEAARLRIQNGFVDSLTKTGRDGNKVIWQVMRDGFIDNLEDLAADIRSRKPDDSPQRRAEKLDALYNSLTNLVSCVENIDDIALGHALFCGLRKAGALEESNIDSRTAKDFMGFVRSLILHGPYRIIHSGGPHLDLLSVLGAEAFNLAAFNLKNTYADRLRLFTLGVLKSKSEIPKINNGYHSAPLCVAEFIWSRLTTFKMKPSTSDTGFAGTVFSETLELIGRPVPRAGYWLRKARDATAKN